MTSATPTSSQSAPLATAGQAALPAAPAQPALAAVRFVGDTPGAEGTNQPIEGLLAPFGGMVNGRDLYGTYFSPRTDFALAWFPDGRPLLFQHGLDAEAGIVPVGRITSVTVRDAGAWMQAQLDASSEYFEAIRELIRQKKLYLSSGAMSHLVDVDARTGEVRRWPIVEGSLTPTPANLLAALAGNLLDQPTAERHYRAIGLDLPAQVLADQPAPTPLDAAASSPPGTPTGDGAVANAGVPPPPAAMAPIAPAAAGHLRVTDPAGAPAPQPPAALRSVYTYPGSYEQRIADLTNALNPSSPFGMASSWACVLATYDDYAIVERCECDGGESDKTYYRVAYTLDANGAPLLGATQEVAPAFLPLPAGVIAEGLPLSMQARALVLAGTSLVRQSRGTVALREGRVLSTATRRVLEEAATAQEAAVTALRDLLAATAPPEPMNRAAIAARLRLWLLDLPPSLPPPSAPVLPAAPITIAG